MVELGGKIKRRHCIALRNEEEDEWLRKETTNPCYPKKIKEKKRKNGVCEAHLDSEPASMQSHMGMGRSLIREIITRLSNP